MKTWCVNFEEPPKDDREYSFIELTEADETDPIESLRHLIPAASWAKLMELVREVNDPTRKFSQENLLYYLREITFLTQSIDGEEDDNQESKEKA